MLRRSERDALARQQLEELGRELAAERAGYEEPEDDGSSGVVLAMPGRHARARPAEPSRWPLPDWVPRLPEYGAGHLAVAAVAVAVALGVTAWIVLRSAPTSVPAPVAQVTRPSASASPVAPTISPSVSPSALSTLVVDVSGRVRHPGIVRLPPGARVVDALRKAGGARPGADLTDLNLARPVNDGEQILVGRHGSSVAAPGSGSAGLGSSGSGSSGPTSKVALNTATLEQLESLPGVGPVTAQKILDWRTAHGRFTAVGELLEVDGIGDKTLADIAPHVTL